MLSNLFGGDNWVFLLICLMIDAGLFFIGFSKKVKINLPWIWRTIAIVGLMLTIAAGAIMYSDNKKTQDEKTFQMDHYGAGHRADSNISIG